MKSTILACLLVFAAGPALALYEIGDKPRNYCWKDINETDVCLDDTIEVRVLLYNAGWCGPCNTEFASIARETAEFEGKPVRFISLSSAGWTSGSSPNKTFLTSWQNKHGLAKAKASFVIAGSPRDAGKDFFKDVYIPNVAIVDTTGKVAFKAINPGVSKIVSEVRKLLPRPVPTRR
jgi:hypothetical protein